MKPIVKKIIVIVLIVALIGLYVVLPIMSAGLS